MEEKKYSIYLISAKWDQDDYKGNYAGYRKMYKEKPKYEHVYKEALEWWEWYANNHKSIDGRILKDKQPILINLEVKYLEEESWCLSWFSHYSYNIDLSNEELERSFASFVDRKLQDKNYCLMGAEDSWRWKVPCRCESCQKQGVVRIDH